MTVTRQAVWWNVQRLLRPNSAPLSKALRATESDGWTRLAFEEKLKRVAEVLKVVTNGVRPAIVGLAEVADDNLAQRVSDLAGLGLRVVREKSSGFAGADVVLLVDPDLFVKIDFAKAYNINNRFSTRDIYQVRLKTGSGHSIDVIACHWPSRVVSDSGHLRIAAAYWCRQLVDAVLKFDIADLVDSRGHRTLPRTEATSGRARSSVMLFGDFNDSPFDESISEVLGCARDSRRALSSTTMPRGRDAEAVERYLSKQILMVNPCWPLLVEPLGGSTYWSGDWYLLDQFIHSPGMIEGSLDSGADRSGSIQIVRGSVRLHAPTEVQVGSKTVKWCSSTGIPAPFDPVSRLGVSDHLPVTCDLSLPEGQGGVN